jgi:hypothetical protein
MLDVGMLVAKETQGKRQKETDLKYVSRWTGWLRPNRSNFERNKLIIINIRENLLRTQIHIRTHDMISKVISETQRPSFESGS